MEDSKEEVRLSKEELRLSMKEVRLSMEEVRQSIRLSEVAEHRTLNNGFMQLVCCGILYSSPSCHMYTPLWCSWYSVCCG